jgi:hypothetical protein
MTLEEDVLFFMGCVWMKYFRGRGGLTSLLNYGYYKIVLKIN